VKDLVGIEADLTKTGEAVKRLREMAEVAALTAKDKELQEKATAIGALELRSRALERERARLSVELHKAILNELDERAKALRERHEELLQERGEACRRIALFIGSVAGEKASYFGGPPDRAITDIIGHVLLGWPGGDVGTVRDRGDVWSSLLQIACTSAAKQRKSGPMSPWQEMRQVEGELEALPLAPAGDPQDAASQTAQARREAYAKGEATRLLEEGRK
jgi:hypothetical protein